MVLANKGMMGRVISCSFKTIFWLLVPVVGRKFASAPFYLFTFCVLYKQLNRSETREPFSCMVKECTVQNINRNFDQL